MMINPEVCTGCGRCVLYCPVEAIVVTGKKTEKGKLIQAIDLEQCVECGNCLRAKVCPVEALYQQPLSWPRSLRSAFSNPQTEHKSKDMGRGTEEMKTNEVTHRFKIGELGVAIELGRPLLGATFRDVERVTRAVGRLNVCFEAGNPLTSLIEDQMSGSLRPDILDERVLSTIVEFKISEDRLEEVLTAVKNVAFELDTVFSLGLISLLPGSANAAVVARAKDLGFPVRLNGKVNLGLGRPSVADPHFGNNCETVQAKGA